ncbi:hypothetical protein [Paenibacillus sp. CAA11]|uniref:hypothetical protein n=1 Tax=Paenibacillus sp. CAA11 TaxID=1532905 RepID=UPI00131F30EF|nr:hypothetical protein [Paenibacillus sp. CAA11]
MIEVVRNPEWKSLAVKIIGLQVVLSVIMLFYMSHQVSHLNKGMVDQNAAFIGLVLKHDPQIENEIIHFVTQGAQENDIVEGRTK